MTSLVLSNVCCRIGPTDNDLSDIECVCSLLTLVCGLEMMRSMMMMHTRIRKLFAFVRVPSCLFVFVRVVLHMHMAQGGSSISIGSRVCLEIARSFATMPRDKQASLFLGNNAVKCHKRFAKNKSAASATSLSTVAERRESDDDSSGSDTDGSTLTWAEWSSEDNASHTSSDYEILNAMRGGKQKKHRVVDKAEAKAEAKGKAEAKAKAKASGSSDALVKEPTPKPNPEPLTKEQEEANKARQAKKRNDEVAWKNNPLRCNWCKETYPASKLKLIGYDEGDLSWDWRGDITKTCMECEIQYVLDCGGKRGAAMKKAMESDESKAEYAKKWKKSAKGLWTKRSHALEYKEKRAREITFFNLKVFLRERYPEVAAKDFS